MIKLIASDLDGSLLNDEKQLPADFEQVLTDLKKQGITFVVASGRNWAATQPVFARWEKELMFICNNGANIYENGQPVISHSLTPQQVKRALDLICTIPGCAPIVFTLEDTVTAPGCDRFMEWAKNPYNEMKWVDSFDDLYSIKEDIFKIAIFDGSGDITNHSYPIIRDEFSQEAAVYVSGDIWVDIVNSNASKGRAIHMVQEKLGIPKENTMAFGDYYNDESLLDAARFPFVMDGGVDLLKEKFPYRAGDNNKGGVTASIKDFVLKK